MNAAIRAVTRSAIYNGMSVKGIYRGYKGLITDEIEDFKTQNVSNIIQRGGTILKTARCAEFKTPEGRKQAYDKLMEHGIDALVAIGGDGSAVVEEVPRRLVDRSIGIRTARRRALIDLTVRRRADVKALRAMLR